MTSGLVEPSLDNSSASAWPQDVSNYPLNANSMMGPNLSNEEVDISQQIQTKEAQGNKKFGYPFRWSSTLDQILQVTVQSRGTDKLFFIPP